VPQVAAMVAGRRHAWAQVAWDRAAVADIGNDRWCWAGGAARFGCEWVGWARE
jgi:hypothetical protein